MAVAETRKLTPAQRQFVDQAKIRMKDLKGMEKDIRKRMTVCPGSSRASKARRRSRSR